MLMKKYSLTVSKETKKRAKRPLRPKPKAERPKEYWGKPNQVHDKFSWMGVFDCSARLVY